MYTYNMLEILLFIFIYIKILYIYIFDFFGGYWGPSLNIPTDRRPGARSAGNGRSGEVIWDERDATKEAALNQWESRNQRLMVVNGG